MCVCAPCESLVPTEARLEHWKPRNQRYICLWAAIWMLVIELVSIEPSNQPQIYTSINSILITSSEKLKFFLIK